MRKEVSRLSTPAAFAGSSIHSNALILRLDPDDPDAEGNEIEAIANAHIEPIADALAEQLAAVAASEATVSGITRIADALPSQRLREALEALLTESSGRGVRVAADNLSTVNIGVNWRLVNEMARSWAQTYSYELVSYINSNSRQFIADSLAGWVQSGAPLSDLIDQLSVRFDSTRARLIGVTESTRAFASGTLATYESAGFAMRPPEDQIPPRHISCRCWISLRDNGDGTWDYVWLTAQDDRVCPLCGPRHLQSIGVAKA